VGIDSSTLTVNWARKLSEHFDQQGIAFLDAPVAGSRPAAEARQLIYLVGGSSDVLEMAKPILESLSGAIHHAGPAGSGAAVKLMVNALLGIQVAAMGELLGFAKNTGLDAARALEIMSSIPVCSPVAGGLGEAMLERQFDPLFPVELAEKDLGYLASTAEAMNTDVPVTRSARSVFRDSIDNGDGGLNITSIAKQYLS
jgi:3-hydroxyisobutyrate dehydrogenase